MNVTKDYNQKKSSFISVNTLMKPKKYLGISAFTSLEEQTEQKFQAEIPLSAKPIEKTVANPETTQQDDLSGAINGNVLQSKQDATVITGSQPEVNSDKTSQAVNGQNPQPMENIQTNTTATNNMVEIEPDSIPETVSGKEHNESDNSLESTALETPAQEPVTSENSPPAEKVTQTEKDYGNYSNNKQDISPSMEKVTIKSGELGQILGQLQNLSPTTALAAYEQAGQVSNEALEKQRAKAEQSLPEIPTPTGLPSGEEPPTKETKQKFLIKIKPIDTFKSAKSGNPGKEYQGQTTLSPAIPVRETHLAGSETGNSATDNPELSKSAQNALENIRLDTRFINTSAGERPKVDLAGEADPSQIHSFQNESNINIQQAGAEATQEIKRDFGENDIFPISRTEKIKSKKTLSASKKIFAGKDFEELALAPEVAVGLNQSLGPALAKRIGEQKEQYDVGKAQFDKDSAKARADADQQVLELNQETRKQQIAEQQKAKSEVSKYRQEWQTEQQKVEQTYQEKAAKASGEQRQKIESEQQKGETKAAQHLVEAEQKAEAEKLKAEQEAGQKKADAKKEAKGFWGWVSSAASALIDGLKKAINFIYDNLRKAVKGYFELAKTLVKGVIELTRQVIVGYIKAYGLILKGLVSVVFVAFPAIAKKINAKIDQAVNAAVKAVNKAADLLKKGVEAVFDFLANTVDSLLGLVQKIYNGIFDAIGMIIRGEFKKIMEGIGNLVAAAKMMPDQFWGQVSEELLGTNLTEPLPFERSAIPKPVSTTQLPRELSGIPEQDLALLNRSTLSEKDVAVDEVAYEEFDPELLASLKLKEGEEIEFGASNDPSRTIAAIKEEMLGKPVSQTTTSDTKTGPALSQEEIAEQELRQLMAQEPEGCSATAKPAEPAKETEIPEAMKIGPLTVGQRARYLVDQMQKGLRQWFTANWPKLLLAAVGALLGFIALNIVTGGAIMAALPLIMQIVSVVMAGVALGRVIDYVGQYLGDGWAGLKEKAAKSLARGLAVGAIELIFALIFNLGTVIKTLKTGLTASIKTAATAVKTTVKTTFENVKELGRIGLKAGRTMIENGKMLFSGLKAGFSKGAKSLDDLAKQLWERVRFKKFRIRFENGWLLLQGYINPWKTIAEIKADLAVMRKEITQVVEEGEIVLKTSKKGATWRKYIDLAKADRDKIAQILRKNKELIQEAKQLKKTGVLDEGILDDFLFRIEGHHAVPKWIGGPYIPDDELLGVARMLHNFNPSGFHTVIDDIWRSSKLFGHIPINKGEEMIRNLFKTARTMARREELLNELRNILTKSYKQVFKEGPALKYALEVMEDGLKQFRF